MTRLEFIATIEPKCREVAKTSGIPYGWFIAEAIQETGGYGQSEVCLKAHNLFGTKGKGFYQGKTGYASFPSWDASIEFQGWQLLQRRYLPSLPLVQAGDFKAYGNAIQKAGYCDPDGPSYGDAIQSIAETYNLLPPKPVAKLSEAQQWAVDNHIFNVPVDWGKPVDYNTLAWALYKSRKG